MADFFDDSPPTFEGEEDPAAEFLAREQTQLASLDNDDGFGFDGNKGDTFGGEDSQFDTFGGGYAPQVAQAPVQVNGGGGYSAIAQLDRLSVEPEKIKKWKEDQKVLLQEKDALEEKQIAEQKTAAKKELEDWYKHRNEQLEKTQATNRAAEEAYLKEIEDKAPGSEFERIARLCDFNPKNSKNTRDVTRFRSILLQLKQSGLLKNGH